MENGLIRSFSLLTGKIDYGKLCLRIYTEAQRADKLREAGTEGENGRNLASSLVDCRPGAQD